MGVGSQRKVIFHHEPREPAQHGNGKETGLPIPGIGGSHSIPGGESCLLPEAGMTSLSWILHHDRLERKQRQETANASVRGGIQGWLRSSRPAPSPAKRPSEAARRLKLDGTSRAQGPIRDGTDHGTRRDDQASALLPLVLAAGSRQGGQSQ